MGIFIKNPDVERKVRELAALRGVSLTEAVDEALESQLERVRADRRRPSYEEIIAATDEFRRKTGLDQAQLNVTRADFDALWELPGLNVEFDPK
ncbi:MAG TPA: type II toxin-antitoxin system VapB family antitoxin [Caulobacteraceae bacterium]|jgi:antitoxin VapB